MSNFIFTLPPPKKDYFPQLPLVYKDAMNTMKAILELYVLQEPWQNAQNCRFVSFIECYRSLYSIKCAKWPKESVLVTYQSSIFSLTLGV